MEQAKVFISCGQRREEIVTVEKVRQVVSGLGFDAYVAVWDNSLKGLKENIFRQLEDSEYFLFIDFKREKLCRWGIIDFVRERLCGRGDGHRGSLFSHQELAIASYLEIEAIGFRQTGVIEKDGIMQAIQLNGNQFDNRDALPDMVKQTILDKQKEGKWCCDWKAQLAMARPDPRQRGDPADLPYIFHVWIENRHWRKTAQGCSAFLASIRRLDQSDGKNVAESLQVKWAGTPWPNVAILAQTSRRFDAFEIQAEEPTRLQWGMAHADTKKVWPVIEEPGEYELIYVVTAQNFWAAKGTFKLDLKEDIAATTLTLTQFETEPSA